MPLYSSSIKDIALWPLPHVALVAAMGMIFGFDLGSVFINHEIVSDFFLIADSKADIISGTYILGFIFGVFIAGYVNYGSGRKLSIISAITVGSLAIFASLVAPNFSILLCSELVIGFSLGLYLVSASLYNCEIMLPVNRGMGLMMTPVGVMAGGFFSFIASAEVTDHPFLVFIGLFITNIILVSIAIVKLSESPRYLALTGSTDAALSVLFKLRHDMGAAARELAEINECCRGESRGFEFFLQNTVYRRLLSYMCIAAFLFNVGGVSVIPYVLIDKMSLYLICLKDEYCYFSVNNQVIYTTFLMAFIGVFLHALSIERNKRRLVVLYSSAIALAALGAALVSSLFPTGTIQQFILFISIMIFVLFSLGSFMVFIAAIAPELMPVRGREFGLASIFMAHGIGLLGSMQMYSPVIHTYGLSGLLAVGFITSLLLLYINMLYLPNPGRLTLESIENRIMSASRFSDINKANEKGLN